MGFETSINDSTCTNNTDTPVPAQQKKAPVILELIFDGLLLGGVACVSTVCAAKIIEVVAPYCIGLMAQVTYCLNRIPMTSQKLSFKEIRKGMVLARFIKDNLPVHHVSIVLHKGRGYNDTTIMEINRGYVQPRIMSLREAGYTSENIRLYTDVSVEHADEVVKNAYSYKNIKWVYEAFTCVGYWVGDTYHGNCQAFVHLVLGITTKNDFDTFIKALASMPTKGVTCYELMTM